MTLPKNKNFILLIIIIALILVGWGLSRKTDINDSTQRPKVSYSSKTDKIQIINQGKITTLQKEDGEWLVKDGDLSFPVNSQAVDEAIKVLKDFKINELVSNNIEKYSDFSVDADSALLVEWYKGDKKQARIYFGKSDYARAGDYVRFDGSSQVYITDGIVSSAFSRPNFKDTQVVSIDQNDITKVSVVYKEDADSFVLVKNAEDGTWNMEQDKETKLNDSVVNSFLSAISNIESREVIPFDKTRVFGFLEPFAQITITTSDRELVITLGDQANEMPAYYVQNQDKQEWVYFVHVSDVNGKIDKKKGDFYLQ